jgi:putative copper resistance protein D
MPQLQRFPILPKGLGRFAATGAFLAALLAVNVPVALAHDPSRHAGHDGMDMSMPMLGQAQSDPAQQAIVLKNKKESEFNHHLAGIFVILAALFLLGENALRQRWPQARFAWPSCFLLAGLFLLVFSDTELWPFGPQSWWYGLTHNVEDLQHKTFAAILLTLGVLEIQRARGVLKAAWAGWVFPVLALGGSVLLLFHEHHGGMHGADHMTLMARIQAEHLNFAIAGSSVGVVKGLSELRTRWQTVFMKSWPLLLIVLGVLLLRYVE